MSCPPDCFWFWLSSYEYGSEGSCDSPLGLVVRIEEVFISDFNFAREDPTSKQWNEEVQRAKSEPDLKAELLDPHPIEDRAYHFPAHHHTPNQKAPLSFGMQSFYFGSLYRCDSVTAMWFNFLPSPIPTVLCIPNTNLGNQGGAPLPKPNPKPQC